MGESGHGRKASGETAKTGETDGGGGDTRGDKRGGEGNAADAGGGGGRGGLGRRGTDLADDVGAMVEIIGHIVIAEAVGVRFQSTPRIHTNYVS